MGSEMCIRDRWDAFAITTPFWWARSWQCSTTSRRRSSALDLGAGGFIRRHDPRRHVNRLTRQIEALGFDVQIQERAAA